MSHRRPNMSKNGLAISERRKSSSILNCQRSMPTVVHKINLSNRLVGGADEEPVVEETPVISSESVQEVLSSLSLPSPSTPQLSPAEKSLEESAQLEENSQNKQLPASGPCCFCISQTLGSVGDVDKKVDEIIEYVHQNLEEASKALATLSKNFEHDLKIDSHNQLECRKTVSMSRRRKKRRYN